MARSICEHAIRHHRQDAFVGFVPSVAPMYATYAADARQRTKMRDWLTELVTGRRTEASPGDPLDPRAGGLGLLELYVCTRCGFVEWYCHDVERIPADPALMTELLDYESETPYR